MAEKKSFWDQKFDTDDYIYGTEPNGFIAENYKEIPKGNILCLAEGEGRNAIFLAKKGYTVTAVDSSAIGLRKAAKLAADNNVALEIIHADMNNFDIGEGIWQGIVATFCHMLEPQRKKLHRGVVRGLAAGGAFIQESYTPKQLKFNTGGPPVAELMYSKKILQEDCKRPVCLL